MRRPKTKIPIPALNLNECYAKTYKSENGENLLGQNVLTHCLIVGEVARALLQRLPKCIQELFPENSEFVAALHDVGKASPTFQEKIRRAQPDYIHSCAGLERFTTFDESVWGGHAGVSQLTLSEYREHKYIDLIVGQHHGFSPQFLTKNVNSECYGGEEWKNVRETLVENIRSGLQCEWPVIKDEHQARLISGLVTVSDWIGSGSTFDNPNDLSWKHKIESSVDAAGFTSLEIVKDLSFEEIFGFKSREVQQKLIHACVSPGVYILEAQMGIGKTEASLYAAYQLLSLGLASGIYYALPTQLTSNKIYERVNAFLLKILDEKSFYKSKLIHGNSKLKLYEMGEDASPGGSWFTSSKREMLFPVGVGTIDQALMAVMNVKHGFVRTFGLAGKVVILDEVHCYDAYTGLLIDELINSLQKLNCTVIILSATLTEKRKAEILETDVSGTVNSYPLISYKTDHHVQKINVKSEKESVFKIHHCNCDNDAFAEAVKRAELGQQVLWIENTVDEAQEVYKVLSTAVIGSDIECGLLHSRFTPHDRSKIEEKWTNLYGKNSTDRVKNGRILIGTQILEQSLDIDADFLITKLCPMDMFLQRVGRLWRHENTIRPKESQREVWFLSHKIEDLLNGSKNLSFVYSPYYLIRTLELLEQLQEFSLPTQLRQLVEATYVDRIEEGKLYGLKRDLEKKVHELKNLALVGIANDGKNISDDAVSTRNMESENVEILLLRSFDKKTGEVVLANGRKIVIAKSSKPSWKEKNETALILMENIVKVSKSKCPQLSRSELVLFKEYLYVDNDSLFIATIQNSNELTDLYNNSDAKHQYFYTSQLGYQRINNE